MTKRRFDDVERASLALRKAIIKHRMVLGDAEWTNGYRCGKPEEEERLRPKEMAQWKIVQAKENAVDRAFYRLIRAVKLQGASRGSTR